ncbi:hypothetical protein VNO77_33724 [Canavalia gladiata]|uniref:Uncharacterized protein n=1 Tax=Canavalia gladiata TaxID=3824 RepID=A0AAN9KG88_CANGL
MDSVGIRSANPYLATPGATVHGHYGEILYEGDILVTFIYEKSRSGDITQGLPKVEQYQGISFSDLMYVTNIDEKAVVDLTKNLQHASDVIAIVESLRYWLFRSIYEAVTRS